MPFADAGAAIVPAASKDSEQQRTEALRRQSPVEHLHHRPHVSDWLLRIDRADRGNGRLCEGGRRAENGRLARRPIGSSNLRVI